MNLTDTTDRGYETCLSQLEVESLGYSTAYPVLGDPPFRRVDARTNGTGSRDGRHKLRHP